MKGLNESERKKLFKELLGGLEGNRDSKDKVLKAFTYLLEENKTLKDFHKTMNAKVQYLGREYRNLIDNDLKGKRGIDI